jgi:hypothetical protein
MVKKSGNYRHGYSRTPIHTTWLSMKRRCDNPNAQNYYLYGGRGIKYEERWKRFESFLEDMGDKPGRDFSLERKDNSLGYSKDNCVWATKEQQANNKRNNRFIEHNGEVKTLSQWAKQAGISTRTLFARLNTQKWPMERAISEGAFIGKNQTYRDLGVRGSLHDR